MRYFNGSLDDVRFWDRAITSTEINAKKCDTLIPSNETGLVNYWKMNEGSASTLNDLGSRNNLGSIAGCTWIAGLICVNAGVDENETAQINLYPNPASTHIYIDKQEQIKHISIVDMTGKIVKWINEDVNTIKVSDLPKATYFIKVQTGKGVFHSRFIKV